MSRCMKRPRNGQVWKSPVTSPPSRVTSEQHAGPRGTEGAPSRPELHVPGSPEMYTPKPSRGGPPHRAARETDVATNRC